MGTLELRDPLALDELLKEAVRLIVTTDEDDIELEERRCVCEEGPLIGLAAAEAWAFIPRIVRRRAA